ncbi:MAG: hypothetical protein WBK08_12450, partial [Nitrospira sp.]
FLQPIWQKPWFFVYLCKIDSGTELVEDWQKRVLARCESFGVIWEMKYECTPIDRQVSATSGHSPANVRHDRRTLPPALIQDPFWLCAAVLKRMLREPESYNRHTM